MTEIKKGTPVWVWDNHNENKSRATYLCYDNLSEKNIFKHIALVDGNKTINYYSNAEPINETNDKALQLIAEAESKIAEAKKLLNAQ